MRTLIAATSLAMALTSATAQKADRYPDPDRDGPRVVRTIPITPSFDQRWFGPREADRWISNQPPPSDRFTPRATQQPAEVQNAPAVTPAPLASLPRARKLSEDTRPAQVLCIKNDMRTVWHGSSWRCRK